MLAAISISMLLQNTNLKETELHKKSSKSLPSLKNFNPQQDLSFSKPTKIYELFITLTVLITVRVFFDNDKIQSYIRWEKVIFFCVVFFFFYVFVLGSFFWHWCRFLSACMSCGIHTVFHKYRVVIPCSSLALDGTVMSFITKMRTQESRYFTKTEG